jgi:hypothetical protein
MFEKIFKNKKEIKKLEPYNPENGSGEEITKTSDAIGKWHLERAKKLGIVLEDRKYTNKELGEIIRKKQR